MQFQQEVTIRAAYQLHQYLIKHTAIANIYEDSFLNHQQIVTAKSSSLYGPDEFTPPTNEVNIGNRQIVSYRGMQALFNGQSKNMVVHILRCEGSSCFWFKYTPTIDLRRQLDDQQIKPQICINFQDMIFFFIYKLLFSKDRINICYRFE